MDGRIEADEVLFEVASDNGQRAILALDTGLTGQIAANEETIRRLGFPEAYDVINGELADGSNVELQVCYGVISWLGTRRVVQAILIGAGRGCIGMGLLQDVIVHIDTHAGVASIDRAV